MVNAKFGEESKESVAEFRFVPSDKSDLEAMFPEMCECQPLHPDPGDKDSDDYVGEEYVVGANEQGEEDIPTFYTFEEGLSIPFNSRRPSHIGEVRRNAFSVCAQPI